MYDSVYGICVPVIRAISVRHCGVSIRRDQPLETLISEEADLLPFGACYITTACIEVTKQHNVLQDHVSGSVTLIPSLYLLIIHCNSTILSCSTYIIY